MAVNYSEEAGIFFEIQVKRYLQLCSSNSFSGLPEQDAVTAMIRDAWVELRASRCIENLSKSGRMSLYYTTVMIFPDFVANGDKNCIPVDFTKGMRADISDISI